MQYVIDIDKENNHVKVLVPSAKGTITEEKVKNFFGVLKKSTWEVEPVQRLSLDQMKMIFALCRDYSEIIGYEPEELRELLKAEFCIKNCIEDFSCSPYKRNAATMKVATEFIQFIIEHALNLTGCTLKVVEGHGKNRVIRSAREIVPDIRKYVIACLMNKTCAICGATTEQREIDLHHWDSVNSIGGYEHDDGLKTRFISLCREHHTEFHNIEAKAFSEKYHIDGVWLSENMVKKLKQDKIYPHHFKAYKLEREE